VRGNHHKILYYLLSRDNEINSERRHNDLKKQIKKLEGRIETVIHELGMHKVMN